MSLKTLLGAAALAATAGLGLMAAPVLAQTAAPAAEAAVEVKEITMGNPDAPVKMTEYASYTCPHCASFHTNVFKELKRDYIDTGKVFFTYREVYFDRRGMWAAMLARCGGDMRYFGIQDVLYSTQADWGRKPSDMEAYEALRKIGLTAGISNEQMDVCFKDAPMFAAMEAKFRADTAADGVESTPTLMIDGKKHSNMSFADLSKILDKELAE